MKNKVYFLLLIFVLSCFVLEAQEDTESDACSPQMEKSIERQFKKARELQKSGKKSDAFAIYDEILETDPYNLEVNYYMAMGYYLPIELKNFIIEKKDKENVNNALACFNRIYEKCPFFKPNFNLYAARLAYFNENFTEAVKFANFILENRDLITKEEYIEETKVILKKSIFYNNILNNPVPFDPKPVQGISTNDDEYLATVSPDGEFFYFTRRMEVTDNASYFSNGKKDKELFCCSEKKKGSFGPGSPMPAPFNQSTNEGSPTINLTNDMLIFAKVTPTSISGQTYPNYDLFVSYLEDGYWSEPQNLGANINRSDSWESQPTLSSDGKLLFFASDRPGGFGGSDIYYSERNSDGSWRKPVNVGPVINTKGNERSPFLHTDSKTLYFSSSGHDGMGEMDVFYSKLDPQKGWQEPVNIGYPINSENDEVDFFVSLDGSTAYFSSNNIDDNDWNIYQFELYEAARPHNMILVKGKVEADDGDIEGTVVEIRDTAAKVIATAPVNSVSGYYAVAAEVNKNAPEALIVNVKKEGHSFDTKLITKEQISNNVVQNDAEVKKVEVGKTYDLHDIYFPTNQYSLTNASRSLIDLFVEFLNDNPSVKVEIQGHTDNIGDDNANQLLSEKRAQSVYDYVLSKHVDTDRVKYKGYGESAPIASNDTPEGRAKNRRTIFLIYEK